MAARVVSFPLLSHTRFVLACLCIVSDCGQSLCLFFIMADIHIWPPSGGYAFAAAKTQYVQFPTASSLLIIPRGAGTLVLVGEDVDRKLIGR